MSNKAGIPQGTRDFNAATVQKRNYIFQTIRTVFELYGFQPLETPAMENLDTCSLSESRTSKTVGGLVCLVY